MLVDLHAIRTGELEVGQAWRAQGACGWWSHPVGGDGTRE
jgi:hypothetical protein